LDLKKLVVIEHYPAEIMPERKETFDLVQIHLGEDDNIGKNIDHYKLLESIGEGGMGTVYMAEQSEPVKRKVALKIIKLGMDTKEVVARFKAEQQALAVMDHPNIARVYDAGATGTGRPYFVMELIRGIPVTKYCDRNKLSTRERIEIFLHICHAVQHAHQKGIIHRDLKPSNILVTEQEDKPVVKIIDFGIAKAIQHRLTEQTLHTVQGQLIGTPEYMSPEQAEMSGLDIDTRSDIFSLGVLLYELLGGVLPFDPKTFQDTGIGEIQSIIREVEPPKVSTRLSKLGDTQTSIAEQRRTDPSSLRNQLKGDLDWITMKAMAKDRTRRYSSASELAADLVRHLNNEPVLASPPDAIYRFKKYVARHKVEVAAAAFVLLAVLAGIVGTSIGMIKARRAERVAKEEARTAQEVTDFLVGLFEVSDPNEAKGDTITAREILDRGAEEIEKGLEDQPVIQSRLMQTMGMVYFNLGLYPQAEQIAFRLLEINRELYGEDHIEVAKSLIGIIFLYSFTGKFEESIPLYRDAIAIMEKNPPSDISDLVNAYTTFGKILRDKGDYRESRSLLEKAIDIQEEASEKGDSLLAFPVYHLGWLLNLTGKYDSALINYERVLPILEKYNGPESQVVAWCLNDMAVVNSNMGNLEEALTLYERALEIQQNVSGPEHPYTASILNNLGGLSWRLGDYSEAKSYWEQTLHIQEKVFGPDHIRVAGVIYNLGLIYYNEGNFDKAEENYLKAISINEKTFGPNHINSSETIHSLAGVYWKKRNYSESRRLLELVLDIKENALEPGHPSITRTIQDLGQLQREAGFLEEARSQFERAAELWESGPNPDSLKIGKCLFDLAILFALQNEFEKAESEYQKSLEIIEKLSQTDDPEVLFLQACYWSASGDKDMALQYLKRVADQGSRMNFRSEPLLESLHGDPEFEALVEEVARRIGNE